MVALILASASPYRRALLQRLTPQFSCQTPAIDETPRDNETAQHLVQRLAQAKAGAVVAAGGCGLIIGSDQAAVLNGQIIGKPGNHAAAVRQLEQASGNQLLFLTGLCLLNSATGKVQVEYVSSKVHFRQLSATTIERYLQREAVYDCAGAFKSEHLGIALLSAIDSTDPTALIGLPLIKLTQMLASEGFEVI